MSLSLSRFLQVCFLCTGCVVLAGCTPTSTQPHASPSPSPEQVIQSPSPVPSPSATILEKVSGTTKEIKTTTDGTMYEYTSVNLGLRFTYVSPKQGAMHVFEQGNMLCITYDVNDNNCEKGQFVEVFEKESKTTLSAAITDQLLTDIPKAQCFVQVLTGGKYSKPKSTFTFAQISYPDKASADDPFSLSTAKNCPEKYRATNGIRYFAMDKKHPEQFFFFSIGQYAIPSGEKDQTWDETVRVVEETQE